MLTEWLVGLFFARVFKTSWLARDQNNASAEPRNKKHRSFTLHSVSMSVTAPTAFLSVKRQCPCTSTTPSTRHSGKDVCRVVLGCACLRRKQTNAKCLAAHDLSSRWPNRVHAHRPPRDPAPAFWSTPAQSLCLWSPRVRTSTTHHRARCHSQALVLSHAHTQGRPWLAPPPPPPSPLQPKR